MSPTFAELKATADLPDVFYCWLFSDILGLLELPEPTATVDPQTALMAWIADLFRKIYFDAETVQVIVRRTAELANLVTSDTEPPDECHGKYQIAILDGRYLAYTGASSLVDLKTGRRVLHSVTSLESVAYDLAVLWQRKLVEVSTCHAKPKRDLDGPE